MQIRLTGRQDDCRRVMTGLGEIFGPGVIGPYGASFQRPGHPGEITVHLNSVVLPREKAQPRRNAGWRARRRARKTAAALPMPELRPVKADIRPAGPEGSRRSGNGRAAESNRSPAP